MNPKESGKHYSSIPRFPRGGIFFTTNRQIEPIGPTQQEIDRSNTVRGNLNGQEGRITTPVTITLASIAGLGAGGVGGWFINDAFGAEKPSETIPVGSFENSFNNSGPQIVPSEQVKKPNKDGVFDPNAERQVITPSMIKRVPQEEIDRQFPTAFGKLNEDGNNEIRALSQTTNPEEKATLPDILIEVREDKGTLQLLYPLDPSKSTNPNAKIDYEKSFSGFGKSVRDAFQGEGYYDGIIFTNVRGGTKILSPLDGFLVITQNEIPGNARPANGTADTDGVIIDFIDNNGNQYRIVISGSTRITKGNPQYPRSAFVFKNLTDASVTPLEKLKEYNRQPIGNYGKLIKRGDPILEVIQPSEGSPVEVGMGVLFALKGTPENKARPLSNPFILTNIEFITSDGKLIAPQKQ